MIQRERKTSSDEVKVRFVLTRNLEELTSVVGDFNNWDPAATTFRRRGGESIASITMPAGRRYAFRYLAGNGSWFDDEEADDYEPNQFGGSNCILDLTGVDVATGAPADS